MNPSKPINVGIIGVSGYSGLQIIELLLKHPYVRVTYAAANSTTGALKDIWPQLQGRTRLVCEKYQAAKARKACDVIFLAVPHTTSMAITPQLLKGRCRVVDLSGDYRLRSKAEYQKWYGKAHLDTNNLSKAVYGLPEFYRVKIATAKLVSNPGCYPTAAILALAPLLSLGAKLLQSISIDAKSGVSGAGKKLNAALMFCESNESCKAYKVLRHQHAPEIDQYLSRISGRKIKVDFVPHLLPCERGILETIYIRSAAKFQCAKIQSMYKKFYKTEPFVRVLAKGVQPELKNVNHTNFCDIGMDVSADGKLLVITSAIDNLMKGAAGQAVQNMNIMCGFDEREGLL